MSAQAAGGRWLHRPAPDLTAPVRLFCLPHAGAGASAYHLWARDLAGVAEVWAVQYPGREWRLNEPLTPRLMDLAHDVASAMRGELAGPYALFGHSMGAVLAFEVARALRARGERAPLRLFVSGRRPPRVRDPWPPMHGLRDRELIAEVRRRFGGSLDAVLAYPDLAEIVLPILRSDICALETHLSPELPPLDCPIDALHGRADPTATRDEMAAWARETTAECTVTSFAGDHFHVQSARTPVTTLVAGRLVADASRGEAGVKA